MVVLVLVCYEVVDNIVVISYVLCVQTMWDELLFYVLLLIECVV